MLGGTSVGNHTIETALCSDDSIYGRSHTLFIGHITFLET